ncbi:hypothetical protein [Cypionkella sinensis]|uniref:DUF3618 domain-containing protein n=1 Tax=Cypionkella sinensis TaxID=1756043 RepID=A0ABV7J6Q5_9RHOB
MRMDKIEPHLVKERMQQDRAALKASLSALGDRFARPGVATDLLNHAQTVGQVARANPVIVSVLGAGLAWYMLRRKPEPVLENGLSGTSFEAKARWEDEGGPAQPIEDDDFDWIEEAEALRAQANVSLHKLESLALDGLDYAKQRAAVLADLAQDVRKAMRRGLEQLSSSAQDRILAAREAAYEAQLSLRNSTAKVVNDHPVAVTSAALALGAAVTAAWLRQPSQERKLAKERDRLLEETRRLLAHERRRAHEAMDILAGSRGLRNSS